jgi:hypothetical protein
LVIFDEAAPSQELKELYVYIKNIPSEEVADLGLADVPPSVVVDGESTAEVPVAPSCFCASATLIFGRAASDMAWDFPCVHQKVSYKFIGPRETFARVLLIEPFSLRRCRRGTSQRCSGGVQTDGTKWMPMVSTELVRLRVNYVVHATFIVANLSNDPEHSPRQFLRHANFSM